MSLNSQISLELICLNYKTNWAFKWAECTMSQAYKFRTFEARILSTEHVAEENGLKLTTPFKSSESAVSLISL